MDLAPKEVHLHIRRYPISTIPLNDDEKLKDWIFQCWKEKDELLDHFKQHQRFPDSKQVATLPHLHTHTHTHTRTHHSTTLTLIH
jgi:hypothetical protein